MIIVTGGVVARPESFEAALELGLAHCRRSRGEPGCLSHDVHVDCEDPLKLVFVERWADAASLRAHFRLEDSIEFVRAQRGLASAAVQMRIYEAEPVRVPV